MSRPGLGSYCSEGGAITLAEIRREMALYDELPERFRRVLRAAALQINPELVWAEIADRGRPALIADRTPGGLSPAEARRRLIEAGSPRALKVCLAKAREAAAIVRADNDAALEAPLAPAPDPSVVAFRWERAPRRSGRGRRRP